MLQPARLDLVCWANAVFPTDAFALQMSDGVPHDLTGVVLTMQVRLRPGATGAALIDLTSEDDTGDYIEVTEAEAGEFVIHISEATLTALLSPLDSGDEDTGFSYDLKVDSEVWLYGAFTLMTGVTR